MLPRLGFSGFGADRKFVQCALAPEEPNKFSLDDYAGAVKELVLPENMFTSFDTEAVSTVLAPLGVSSPLSKEDCMRLVLLLQHKDFSASCVHTHFEPLKGAGRSVEALCRLDAALQTLGASYAGQLRVFAEDARY